MVYLESNRPSLTGISGPPQSATASAPATAIKSAHDTTAINFESREYTKTEIHRETSKAVHIDTLLNTVDFFLCFSYYLFSNAATKYTLAENMIFFGMDMLFGDTI